MEDPEGKEVRLEVKKDGVEITEFLSDTAGVYELSCTAIDNYGDRSETIIIQVHVIEDETSVEENSAPVINAEDRVIKLGSNFDPLEGVTAFDKEEGYITDRVEVTGDTVDTNKEGTYKVTYTVKDSEGKVATKTITITVKLDIILAESISIDNKFSKLYLGGSKILTATVNEAADVKEVEWITSDENVASIELVRNSAKVIAKSEGKVTITASTKDGSNKADSVIIDIVNLENDNEVPSFVKDI